MEALVGESERAAIQAQTALRTKIDMLAQAAGMSFAVITHNPSRPSCPATEGSRVYSPFADLSSALKGLSDALKATRSDEGVIFATSATSLISVPVAYYRTRAPGAYQWFHGIRAHYYIHIPCIPVVLERAAFNAAAANSKVTVAVADCSVATTGVSRADADADADAVADAK